MKIYPTKFFFLWLFFLTSCSSNQDVWKIAASDNLLQGQKRDENPYLIGFLQEALLEVSKKNGVAIELIDYPQEDFRETLRTNKVDGVFSFKEKNPVSERRYLFSAPILDLGVYFVVANSSLLRNEDFNGKVVGLVEDKYLAPLLSKYPNVITRTCKSYAEAFTSLEKNEIEAVVAQKILASQFINEFYLGKMEISSKPLLKNTLTMQVLHGKGAHFLEKIDRTFSDLKKEGTLEKLEKKWSLRSF